MTKEISAQVKKETSPSVLDAYTGKTILITGGRGFIGSALTQSLAAVNAKLILLDRSKAGVWMPEHDKAEVAVLNGDVTIPSTWESVLSGVDCIFHLASQDYIRGPDADPSLDLQINALSVLHMLEICRRSQFFPHIVFASSANLFGLVDSLPVNEDYLNSPLIPWVAHKLLAENYLRIYAEQYGIGSTILRLTNIYGPTPRRPFMNRVVINSMIAKALAGETLTLYVNHGCIRDYLFLSDVVQAFLLAGIPADPSARRSDMYVIGSGRGNTIAETWKLIADRVSLHTNKTVPVDIDLSIEVRPFEMRNFIANSMRFHSATGWEPRVGMTEGIDLTIQALTAS